MNITSFLIYCVIVTFTPGPTNIVILSTTHNLGTKKAMEYSYGATMAFGLLLGISSVLNTVLVAVIPEILIVMQVIGSLYMLYLAYQIYKMDVSESAAVQNATFVSGFLINMDRFIYKKSAGITALSASFTDFKYKKHSHQEYALGVTLRGIQEYNLDGSLQLSYQNGVMLFNPEQPHDGMAHDKSGLDYVMVYIEPKMFLEILEKKDIVRFSSPIVYNYRLQQIIQNLSRAILSGKDEALCSELLLSLSDSFTQPNLCMSYKKDNHITSKAKDMIHYNLENVLKLDDICRELDISKFQFIRMFKASTGISPYQYFLNCKVERAKQLIEKTKDVYSAVAECGFFDLTHLNKHFKCIFGITAFEYLSFLS